MVETFGQRQMGDEPREAFLRELRECIEPFASDQGIEVEPEIYYFHAQKAKGRGL